MDETHDDNDEDDDDDEEEEEEHENCIYGWNNVSPHCKWIKLIGDKHL